VGSWRVAGGQVPGSDQAPPGRPDDRLNRGLDTKLLADRTYATPDRTVGHRHAAGYRAKRHTLGEQGQDEKIITVEPDSVRIQCAQPGLPPGCTAHPVAGETRTGPVAVAAACIDLAVTGRAPLVPARRDTSPDVRQTRVSLVGQRLSPVGQRRHGTAPLHGGWRCERGSFRAGQRRTRRRRAEGAVVPTSSAGRRSLRSHRSSPRRAQGADGRTCHAYRAGATGPATRSQTACPSGSASVPGAVAPAS